MGRVPKATISLMNWNARLESICGSGPSSAGTEPAAGVGTVSGAAALAPLFAFSAGVDDDPLLQAVLASMNISRGARKLNHGGHRGTRGNPVRGLCMVLRMACGLMVSP